MKVFVTGASGFVGGHVVEALRAAGHDVRAMARSDASAEKVREYGASPVRCSLEDLTADHLGDAEAVVHCAAYVEEYGTRAEFWRGNVEGTERVLAAARAAGVSRFVHMSSEAAVFDGSPLRDVDEDCAYPARHRFLYSETKAAAEQRVLAANAPGFVTLSLRPRLVWGPRDTTVLPVVRRMAESGEWVWLDGGRARTSTTHVENVAHAAVLALEHGVGGEAYFLSDDETTTVKDFLSRYVGTVGVELRGPSLPGAVARPLARAVEGLWRALGVKKTPPLTGFAVANLSRDVTVRIDKARAELGYVPRVSLDNGLARLAAA